MKVLIFHNLLWTQYKSVVFEQISNELNNKKDSSLFVIQTAITENSRKDLVDFDLKDFPFKYPFKLISKEPLESISHFKIFYKKIYYIRKLNPDVINLTGYFEPSTLLVLIYCKIFKIKTIITNESIYKNTTAKSLFSFFKKVYKILLFKLTDGFFSYGIHSNNFLFRHGVPKSKILSFLNTFDKTKFITKITDLNINYKYILFVGRLSSEKNLIELLRSFYKIQQAVDNLKLIIIGNGPEKQLIEQTIEEFNLKNKILLLGTIKWNQLFDYYKHAECLILPSISETWGMVANEAQELDLPVITSDNCGCSNDLIIHNYSGLVINGNISSNKNIQIIIDYILDDKKPSMHSFISKNKKIHDLERLSKEMISGFNQIVLSN